MSRQRRGEPNRATGLFVIALLVGIGYVGWLAAGAPNVVSGPDPAASPAVTLRPEPTRTLRPTRTPRVTATEEAGDPGPTPGSTVDRASLPKVGVVAGHWQNDSGAVCPDGLQEVSINVDVASRVVAILQYEGYAAELLAEYAPELNGYQADAFVSVHADSCEIPEASGFKVARLAYSAIPEQEDRLVACLIARYRQATGLRLHENSITFDMTEYHAFNEIDPQTPGAIIELGFMAADRALLTENSFAVAQGVARGIACFLEGEEP